MDSDKLLDKLAINEIKTQSDYLADKIKNMIVSRDFHDGFVFPNENEFCKKLNVSRSTLREAYKILDTQGFIHRTKHGTYVKCRDDIAKQGDFAASLELADNHELVEFVCALEPEAVYLAAQKVDAAGLAKVEELMIACENVAENYKDLVEKNYQFHAYIRELADNNLITSALTAYYDIFNHQVIEDIYAVSADPMDFMKNSLIQHRQLFDALKDHDADEAKSLEYKHLLDSFKYHLKLNRK